MIEKIEIGIRLLFGGFVIISIGFITRRLELIIIGIILIASSIKIINYEKEICKDCV